MREGSKSYKFAIAFIFLLNLLVGPLLMSSTPFLQVASAHARDIIDTTTLVYKGPGTVTFTVKDDDNIRLGVGLGSNSITVA